MQKNPNSLDSLVIEFDKALRAITGVTPLRRPIPKTDLVLLSDEQKSHAAGLMRVNHVGEVCAQALYQSQKITSRSSTVKAKLDQAALEEEDHLAWCSKRLEQLGSRPSLLNPVWYAGSFIIGSIAGIAGDKWSLGFVAETEYQVEKHLDGHLEQLPIDDLQSRAIVEQMRDDEIAHGRMAVEEGGVKLPIFVKKLMGIVSSVMTKTAYKI